MAKIKGIWRFNETLTGITPAVFEGLKTTDLNDIKISFTAYTPSLAYDWSIIGLYYAKSNDIDGFCLQTESNYGDSGYWFYGNTADAWYNNYPVWDFGEEQDVSDEFYAWVTANATKQGGKTPTEITYNGTETTIETGQTATLACNGKKALTDVEVVFGVDGSITYNGTETAVSAGQTATMTCAGKKMLTDVVISV